MLRDIGQDDVDYVRLRFMYSDLNDAFILPVVKTSVYDSSVACEVFARILPRLATQK